MLQIKKLRWSIWDQYKANSSYDLYDNLRLKCVGGFQLR